PWPALVRCGPPAASRSRRRCATSETTSELTSETPSRHTGVESRSAFVSGVVRLAAARGDTLHLSGATRHHPKSVTLGTGIQEFGVPLEARPPDLCGGGFGLCTVRSYQPTMLRPNRTEEQL